MKIFSLLDVLKTTYTILKSPSSPSAEFQLLMFHNSIVKMSEKLNKRNLLKICLLATYPTDFCIICIPFYYEGPAKSFVTWIGLL